jgi:hypothetical protein
VANPAGTRANRWNQVVSAVATEAGWTTAVADAWLNQIWAGLPFDENAGDLVNGERLRKWLEFNQPDAPTLPEAFRRFVV